MKALILAHAYVNLDRLAFYQLEESGKLQGLLAEVKKHLNRQEALGDLQSLCEAGAESKELLWILGGCEGLPGLSTAQKLFGWSADELKKGLDAIELAAAVMEKTRRHPFGVLIHAVLVPADAQGLRHYAELARAAQRGFGHGTHWFLNIAKARLVIHVTHQTKGHPHDREISGLIAAMTGTRYEADAQKRWRQMHQHLIADKTLDPYTIQTPKERERSALLLRKAAAQHPDVRAAVAASGFEFVKLVQSRLRPPR